MSDFALRQHRPDDLAKLPPATRKAVEQFVRLPLKVQIASGALPKALATIIRVPVLRSSNSLRQLQLCLNDFAQAQTACSDLKAQLQESMQPFEEVHARAKLMRLLSGHLPKIAQCDDSAIAKAVVLRYFPHHRPATGTEHDTVLNALEGYALLPLAPTAGSLYASLRAFCKQYIDMSVQERIDARLPPDVMPVHWLVDAIVQRTYAMDSMSTGTPPVPVSATTPWRHIAAQSLLRCSVRPHVLASILQKPAQLEVSKTSHPQQLLEQLLAELFAQLEAAVALSDFPSAPQLLESLQTAGFAAHLPAVTLTSDAVPEPVMAQDSDDDSDVIFNELVRMLHAHGMLESSRRQHQGTRQSVKQARTDLTAEQLCCDVLRKFNIAGCEALAILSLGGTSSSPDVQLGAILCQLSVLMSRKHEDCPVVAVTSFQAFVVALVHALREDGLAAYCLLWLRAIDTLQVMTSLPSILTQSALLRELVEIVGPTATRVYARLPPFANHTEVDLLPAMLDLKYGLRHVLVTAAPVIVDRLDTIPSEITAASFENALKTCQPLAAKRTPSDCNLRVEDPISSVNDAPRNDQMLVNAARQLRVLRAISAEYTLPHDDGALLVAKDRCERLRAWVHSLRDRHLQARYEDMSAAQTTDALVMLHRAVETVTNHVTDVPNSDVNHHLSQLFDVVRHCIGTISAYLFTRQPLPVTPDQWRFLSSSCSDLVQSPLYDTGNVVVNTDHPAASVLSKQRAEAAHDATRHRPYSFVYPPTDVRNDDQDVHQARFEREDGVPKRRATDVHLAPSVWARHEIIRAELEQRAKVWPSDPKAVLRLHAEWLMLNPQRSALAVQPNRYRRQLLVELRTSWIENMRLAPDVAALPKPTKQLHHRLREHYVAPSDDEASVVQRGLVAANSSVSAWAVDWADLIHERYCYPVLSQKSSSDRAPSEIVEVQKALQQPDALHSESAVLLGTEPEDIRDESTTVSAYSVGSRAHLNSIWQNNKELQTLLTEWYDSSDTLLQDDGNLDGGTGGGTAGDAPSHQLFDAVAGDRGQSWEPMPLISLVTTAEEDAISPSVLSTTLKAARLVPADATVSVDVSMYNQLRQLGSVDAKHALTDTELSLVTAVAGPGVDPARYLQLLRRAKLPPLHQLLSAPIARAVPEHSLVLCEMQPYKCETIADVKAEAGPLLSTLIDPEMSMSSAEHVKLFCESTLPRVRKMFTCVHDTLAHMLATYRDSILSSQQQRNSADRELKEHLDEYNDGALLNPAFPVYLNQAMCAGPPAPSDNEIMADRPRRSPSPTASAPVSPLLAGYVALRTRFMQARERYVHNRQLHIQSARSEQASRTTALLGQPPNAELTDLWTTFALLPVHNVILLGDSPVAHRLLAKLVNVPRSRWSELCADRACSAVISAIRRIARLVPSLEAAVGRWICRLPADIWI